MTSIMPTTALTYEELAARTGMSLASARRLVHRRKWRKAKGNDGRAVVQVANEFLEHLRASIVMATMATIMMLLVEAIMARVPCADPLP